MKKYPEGFCDEILPGKTNIRIYGCVKPKGHQGNLHVNGRNEVWTTNEAHVRLRGQGHPVPSL